MALFTLMSLFSVRGFPVEPPPRLVSREDHQITTDAPPVILHAPAEHRTAVVAVCLAYMFLLALAQAYRAGRLSGQRCRTGVTDILVFVQGFNACAFVLATGILVSGLGMQTDAQCHAAIRICIAFYYGGKVVLYCFFLERAHIVRAPFMKRTQDWIWVVGMITIIGVMGSLTAYGSVGPKSTLSRHDGLCRIGIRPDATIAILIADSVINIALTSLFVWLLRPALNSPAMRNRGAGNGSPRRSAILMDVFLRGLSLRRGPQSFDKTFKAMLWRNVLGSSVILLNTIANTTVYLAVKHASLDYICLLTCLTDLTVAVLVINWLTLRAHEHNEVGATSSHSRDTSSKAISPEPSCKTELSLDSSIHKNKHTVDTTVLDQDAIEISEGGKRETNTETWEKKQDW